MSYEGVTMSVVMRRGTVPVFYNNTSSEIILEREEGMEEMKFRAYLDRQRRQFSPNFIINCLDERNAEKALCTRFVAHMR